MSPVSDVLASPALPLLLELEAEGFTLAADRGRLLVRPHDRLSADRRALLARERDALLTLLRICDSDVQRRREAFAIALETDTSGAALPLLVLTPGLPYVAGRCFSCGDPLDRSTYGRCWRCALAWRLALRLPVPAEYGAALDSAKRIA